MNLLLHDKEKNYDFIIIHITGVIVLYVLL
jgi:hypothetical protein